MTISAGSSLALKAVGADQFGNAFADPIPVRWYTEDVGFSIATFPPQPLAPRYLAIRNGSATMNLFTPQEESFSYVWISWSETTAAGTRTLFDSTGVLRSVSNAPSTFVVDIFSAPGDGSIPASGAPTLSSVTAGQGLAIRLTAADTFGQQVNGFNYSGNVTLRLLNAGASAGWPLPVDATVGNPTVGIRVHRAG
jgi:hypothetical protein